MNRELESRLIEVNDISNTLAKLVQNKYFKVILRELVC